ncbi:MAG: hypothetical protein H6686_04560 [Fibrobacteria bacterium]|nr:hypothetical protein [Fibrobacteria bacterium]
MPTRHHSNDTHPPRAEGGTDWKRTVLEVWEQEFLRKKGEAHRELALLDEAASAETKSSAGDKYETAREMFAQARVQHRKSLEESLDALAWLERQKMTPPAEHVRAGALVRLDGEWILVGPLVAKVVVQGVPVQGMSLASPRGQVLKGARVGETRRFREVAVAVQEIL